MYRYEHSIRVRYAETDQMGYVYYGNYATYYEVARVEALRALGFPYSSIEKTGIIMPVTENYSKYIRPARCDDLLIIKLEIRELPKKRVTFSYEIYNESGKLLHNGYTVLAFVDIKTGKSVELPDNMKQALAPYFHE